LTREKEGIGTHWGYLQAWTARDLKKKNRLKKAKENWGAVVGEV